MTADKTFDAFVFDLDGTLLDTLPDLVSVTNRTLRRFGQPEHTRDEILAMVGNGLRSLISQAVPADTSDDELERELAYWKEAYRLLRPRTHDPVSWNDGNARRTEGPRQKTRRAVKQVRRRRERRHGPLHARIHGLRAGRKARAPQADPEGLLLVAKTLGVAPERVAYVGDSADTDMLVAHNAGAFGIGVTWGYQPIERLAATADALIDEPRETARFRVASLAGND